MNIRICFDACKSFFVFPWPVLLFRGTSSHEGIRYLAFEHFPDTLTTTLREHPEGLSEKIISNKDNLLFRQGRLYSISQRSSTGGWISTREQSVSWWSETREVSKIQKERSLNRWIFSVYFDSKEKHDYYKVKLAHFNMISAREIVESGTSEQVWSTSHLIFNSIFRTLSALLKPGQKNRWCFCRR